MVKLKVLILGVVMSWVMVNGIRVLLDEGATVDDYQGLVTEATAQMIQFKETWGDDEVFAIARKGSLYTLQRGQRSGCGDHGAGAAPRSSQGPTAYLARRRGFETSRAVG
jgi:hypothetical protein